MDCPDCDFRAKSASGLAKHRMARHAPAGDLKSNERALAVTIQALRDAKRLEPVDEARVVALESMARSLDLNPFNSQMFREYREALEGLMADGPDDSALDDLLERLKA